MTKAAIILAAGESKRLGQAKQLLLHDGITLLRRAVHQANESGAEQVVVVTGAYDEEVTAELASQLASEKCRIAHNAAWQQGMGSSIACGARFVSAMNPPADYVLLQLCDQPFIPAAHFRALFEMAASTSMIAATQYPDLSPGIPACFPANYLSTLAKQSGQAGAKSLISAEESTLRSCPEAAIDIDVLSDLGKLKQ